MRNSQGIFKAVTRGKKSVVIVREVWTESLLDWLELDCSAVYEVKVYLIEM